MKNQTTLSLLTATIIGLTGCGGGATDATTPSVNSENNKVTILGLGENYKVLSCEDNNQNYICDNEESNISSNLNQKMLLTSKPGDPPMIWIAVPVIDDTPISKTSPNHEDVNSNYVNVHLPKQESNSYNLLDAFELANNPNWQKPDAPSEVTLPILKAMENNLKLLRASGIVGSEAHKLNLNITTQRLIDVDLESFNSNIAQECQEDEACTKETLNALEKPLKLNKEEAYSLAIEARADAKALVNDKLIEEFVCEAGEVRTIQHYGVEDIFSLANGPEVSQPSSAVLTTPWIANYPYPVTGYDEVSNDRIFADNITGLPQSITKGMFYIGLKSNGSSLQGNDTLKVGDYATIKLFNAQLSTLPWNSQMVSNTTPTTTIYYQEFSAISLLQNGQSSGSLLDLVQSQNHFDVVVEDDTSVDFITVATCSTPNPIQEIEKVVNDFECSEKEGKLFWVRGGTLDAFSPTADQATVVSNDFLTRANPYAVTGYDATSYDKHLLDTLSLPSGVITKAEFAIGYKPLGSSLVGNDTIHIGEYGVEHAGGRYILYPSTTTPNPTEPLWQVSSISNGEIVRKVNLANINTTSLNIPVINWMQGKTEFEVRIEDDTAVDFTQLNLCVITKDESNISTTSSQGNSFEEYVGVEVTNP